MSRLDQHIANVQNKLALDRFLDALARTMIIFGIAVWIAVLIDRLFWLRLPKWHLWVYGGLGVATIAAIIIAIRRRPTALDAAARIDQVLNTNDKFATALHVRQMSDPFAHAALLDAERTAEDVSLHKRFPLTFPRVAYIVPIVAAVVLCTASWLEPMDLFGRKEKQHKQAEQIAKVDEGKKALNDALASVSQVPKALEQNESIKMAKETLLQQLNQPITDPSRAQRTAAKALQDVNEAIKDEIKKNQRFAEAENEMKMMKQLAQNPVDQTGPLAPAQREIAKGNFSDAMTELDKVVQNFDKMSDADKEKAAQQMQKLAQQMQQAANNPQQQQQQQQQQNQLQQMGANQQQAKQMQQLMQKAAQGDQQAQKQLQQMAQQMMKQMNNGQGPNQQQQQQIQQAMQQMQAQANAQQNAQQMQQAAQQMAKAMQQAAQQQQGKNGQQGQKGQQGQQQAQQQMAKAQQQMQQQMQQMQAMANDQQQVAAAQQAAQNAADQAMNDVNGGQGNPGGQNGGQGNWQGQGNNQGGDQNQPWGGKANDGMGPNQGGKGAGDHSAKAQAPFGIKPEISPSIDDEKGRILANTLVKDSAMKGESKEQLKEIAASAVQNATDEVEQDRVSRQSQNVVKEYFGSIQKDAETGAGSAAPATQPSK